MFGLVVPAFLVTAAVVTLRLLCSYLLYIQGVNNYKMIKYDKVPTDYDRDKTFSIGNENYFISLLQDLTYLRISLINNLKLL